MNQSFRKDVRVAVLTISDRCYQGRQVDISGPAVVKTLVNAGVHTVIRVETLPDEVNAIEESLRQQSARADLIVTTGGTGLSPRDVTPEVTRMVCERLVDGIPERMRAEGLKHTPMAPLSRGVCGTLGTTLILNLPGSPAGAVVSLEAVIGLLPHALDLLGGHAVHHAELHGTDAQVAE